MLNMPAPNDPTAASLQARLAAAEQELARTRAELAQVRRANDSITAALSRSEERLRLITDTIPAQISYFDREQIYRYANKGYSSWFGLPEAEVIGSPIARVIGEKGYNSVRHYITRALAGETITHEYTMRQKGRLVNARSTMVPELGPDGVPIGCFVFSFDITETRRMQMALAQAQKMEAIGQLTGGVAHDFNNLLTIIIGNLSALEALCVDCPDSRDLLDPALQAARRGAQLIKSLLSFSRQQPLKPVAVDVGKLVAGLETLIRRSLPSSIRCSSHLPTQPLHSRVDPGQLESALLNFALNARDAMPEGGRLSIRVRPGLLRGRQAEELALPPGPYVCIHVSDTGCGMDEATRSRIFEPFFTTKGFGQGSGLGLSMVYGFARQSGGNVKVSSKPGRGSRFTLILPPAPPGSSAEAARPEEQAPTPVAPGTLVLLVEDEPEVRRVVRQQLLALGYSVLEAENGNQAAEIIAQVEDIRVLLTDVIMPGGMNGRELARLAQAQRPALRVVLMSGYEEPTPEDPHTTPPFPLLGKPFTQAELAHALQS